MLGFRTITELDFARAKCDSVFRGELLARLRRQHAWFRRMGFVLLALSIPIAIIWILSWNHLRDSNLPLKFSDVMPMFMFLLMLFSGTTSALERDKCDMMIKALILTSEEECRNLLDRSKSA